jgi:hypothetical protein
MLQVPYLRDNAAVLSCAYHFKAKACFMLQANTCFSRHRLISVFKLKPVHETDLFFTNMPI